MAVTRCPHDFHGVGIKNCAGWQTDDLVANRGGRGFWATDCAVGVETDFGLKTWVVWVKGKNADAQRLAFEDVPGFRRVKLRRSVGVEHIEHQVTRHAGGDGLTTQAWRCVGGGERDGNGEAAVLCVARRPA